VILGATAAVSGGYAVCVFEEVVGFGKMGLKKPHL